MWGDFWLLGGLIIYSGIVNVVEVLFGGIFGWLFM